MHWDCTGQYLLVIRISFPSLTRRKQCWSDAHNPRIPLPKGRGDESLLRASHDHRLFRVCHRWWVSGTTQYFGICSPREMIQGWIAYMLVRRACQGGQIAIRWYQNWFPFRWPLILHTYDAVIVCHAKSSERCVIHRLKHDKPIELRYRFGKLAWKDQESRAEAMLTHLTHLHCASFLRIIYGVT